MKPIKNQVIVITGASSGIGLSTAKTAAKRGAKVVLSSRNSEDLEAIVKHIVAAGGEASFVTADVTKIKDLEKLRAHALEKYGRIDTWINNAGITLYGKLLETSIDEEKLVFETNFWGVRNGAHIAIPALKLTKGTLINVGSDVSQRAIPLQGIYSASKHAVKSFTDALRMELEKDEVEVMVSLIRPSAVDTPYTEHALNRMKSGEPSLSGTVYHPSVVAKAILACAEKPEREVMVGGNSKMVQILDVIAPRVVEIIMEEKMFEDQQKGSKKKHVWENEGLNHKPKHEGQVTGGHKGLVLKTASPKSDKDSVIPLLSQGMNQLLILGTHIAQNQVKPKIRAWQNRK